MEYDKVKEDGKVTTMKSLSLSSEEFTIVLLTYNRIEKMLRIIQKLSGLSQLNQVIVIWNNLENPYPSDLKWPKVEFSVRVSHP